MRFCGLRVAMGLTLLLAGVLAWPGSALGQGASYLNHDGLTRELRSVANSSDNVRMESLGTTLEGREIWAFVVSDAPDPDTPDLSRPAVFYNSLTHAREPIGVMQLLAFVEDIARGWTANDLTVQSLLGSRELWFVPVINPDGYYFNEVWRPGGGGMWRKNKRDNDGDGVFDPDVDGEDPLAFPTYLVFNQEIVTFTMTPVPEPSCAIIVAVGFAALLRRRKG